MRKERLIIGLGGLSLGKHLFTFEIQDRFFEHIENSLINKGNAEIKVELEKMSSMLQLHFSFTGNVEIECDRCLTEAFVPLQGKDELIVKIGGDQISDNPNIITIGYNETELDLTQFIYEIIALNLPLKKIPCTIINDFSICNEEMLNKLDNISVSKMPDTNTVNPLWESLNKLKN
ncbi:MAG: DUF177 domain-containing protein [Bacteroidia bacterium]|nr:DUF177 domain-containing protein [Bacteroidia bacterium]MCZ2248847.1 DUF177 domain-containing protein [Bacteroidia bacterium]